MKRRWKRRPPRDYLIAAGLSLLLVALLFAFWGLFRKEEVARHAAEDGRRQLAALAAREESLSKTIAELDTERGKEASLRETYGVAKPGEEVIIVVPAEERGVVPNPTWWDTFLSWFRF